jgi:diguanylate cyclase (GGDEF)-like protein
MNFFPTSFHFRHYVYLFLGIALTIFIISGLFIYEKIKHINNSFIEDSVREASIEVNHALDSTLEQIAMIAGDITEWDEIHQQISTPAYYGYWKKQRANTKTLPVYISGFDIYNTDMNILGNTDDPDSLPHLTETTSHFILNDHSLYHISIFPVYSRVDSKIIIGYLMMRADIITALTSSGRLVITDQASIRIKPGHTGTLTKQSVLETLEFDARKNPLFEELLFATKSTFVYGFTLIVLFTILFYFIITRIVKQPLDTLTDYIENLKSSTPRKQKKISFGVYEFDKLKQTIDNYQQELERIHNNLDEKNEELWKLAHNDSLTSTSNRRAYEEDWNSYISIANYKRLDFSYMLIDCDHFKAINDTYGHDVGDKVIICLAKIFQDSLREGDKLYRIGGDEFVTILWNTDAETADKIAQRCVENIRSQNFDNIGIHEPVTISIGIATRTKDSTIGLEALPRQADLAMYHAKKAGSRSIIHYNPSLETDIAPLVSNRIIDAVIKAAQNSEGIILHYQPVVNALSGRIDYYEALLRIRDSQGIIGAGDIFPVAEKLSLEAELDLAVLKSVEQDLNAGLLPENTGVSINFSAALFSLPDLLPRLTSLTSYLSRQTLVFEVTEKTLITDINTVSRKLAQLRELGFKIALDDFGSGYSSIRYLANMPIDIVKFDISMTRQLLTEDKSRSIISGTAAVILGSGFKLVAEGIENIQLQDLVINMGATHLQGYAIGKPMPLNGILRQDH